MYIWYIYIYICIYIYIYILRLNQGKTTLIDFIIIWIGNYEERDFQLLRSNI